MSSGSGSELSNGFNGNPESFTLRKLLIESLNREKELKKLLSEQMMRNDQLQIQIEVERKQAENPGKTTFWDLKKAFEKLAASFS